jgi:hypothetical protein
MRVSFSVEKLHDCRKGIAVQMAAARQPDGRFVPTLALLHSIIQIYLNDGRK